MNGIDRCLDLETRAVLRPSLVSINAVQRNFAPPRLVSADEHPAFESLVHGHERYSSTSHFAVPSPGSCALVLIYGMTSAGIRGQSPWCVSGPAYASFRPTPPHPMHSPHFAAINQANAQSIQAVAQANADAIRMQAEAENQALLARTRAQVEAETMLQEHRTKALEAEASRIDRLMKSRSQLQQDGATVSVRQNKAARMPHVTPVKSINALPAASTVKWDAGARSGAKHLREIVADRAPSRQQGSRLWARMMEMPAGSDNVALHVRLMIRYKRWAYWTEAGFLFHPCCIQQINKELDDHGLPDHLQWVLAN